MATAILKNYPVWLFTNKGDLESSQLLYQTIQNWQKDFPDGI